jgi:Spy/CpxP family protein refolding chaperone
VLAAIVTAIAAAGVAAQGRAPGRGPGFGMPGLERLNLSEDQRTDLQKLFVDQREQGRFEHVGRLERELQQALIANPSDLETLHGFITKIVDAQRAQLEARVVLQQKVIQILTPEQRQQLSEFYASAPNRRGPPREILR